MQAVVEHPTALAVRAARRSRSRRCDATVVAALAQVELHQRPRLEQRLRFRGLGFERGNSTSSAATLDVGGPLDAQRVLLGGDRRRPRPRAAYVRRRDARREPFDPSSSCTARALGLRGRGSSARRRSSDSRAADQRVGSRIARR